VALAALEASLLPVSVVVLVRCMTAELRLDNNALARRHVCSIL
jgi:hypothetical protein